VPVLEQPFGSAECSGGSFDSEVVWCDGPAGGCEGQVEGEDAGQLVLLFGSRIWQESSSLRGTNPSPCFRPTYGGFVFVPIGGGRRDEPFPQGSSLRRDEPGTNGTNLAGCRLIGAPRRA